MSSIFEIFDVNDNIIEVQDLKVAATDTWITSASGTANVTIKDSTGTEITSGSPVTLSYVAGTNATWRGTLADTADIDPSAEYTAVISIDVAAGQLYTYTQNLRSVVRGA